MKFYTIIGDRGETVGCERTIKAAKVRAEEYGFHPGEYSVEMVEVDVNAETVRLLLAEGGGYAKSTKTVIEAD